MKTESAALLPMITIDRGAQRPLHQQVYEAYRRAITQGALRAAQQVPSTRVLASELGVSRIPVSLAGQGLHGRFRSMLVQASA